MINRIECSTAPGIPDTYIMFHGVGFWLEAKEAWIMAGGVMKISFRPAQHAWHTLHHKAGGTSFLMVRVPQNPPLFLDWRWGPQLRDGSPSEVVFDFSHTLDGMLKKLGIILAKGR